MAPVVASLEKHARALKVERASHATAVAAQNAAMAAAREEAEWARMAAARREAELEEERRANRLALSAAREEAEARLLAVEASMAHKEKQAERAVAEAVATQETEGATLKASLERERAMTLYFLATDQWEDLPATRWRNKGVRGPPSKANTVIIDIQLTLFFFAYLYFQLMFYFCWFTGTLREYSQQRMARRTTRRRGRWPSKRRW